MRNLNVHDLKRSLDCLCNCLQDLYNVNYGGCCLIAYYMALHLDKLGVNYKLVVYDKIKRQERSINQEVVSMVKAGDISHSITGSNTCNHYCIYLVGGGIVNRGEIDGDFKHTIHSLRARNIKWIYKSGSWNKRYNTSNNESVKGIIDSFFKKYE